MEMIVELLHAALGSLECRENFLDNEKGARGLQDMSNCCSRHSAKTSLAVIIHAFQHIELHALAYIGKVHPGKVSIATILKQQTWDACTCNAYGIPHQAAMD